MTNTNNGTAIQVQQLVKRYGSLTAVDDISFQVQRGEVFGLLGPNGAGKTTTIECIEGLRAPDSGEIHVLGLDARRDLQPIKERIGIQLQATGLYPKLTVREVIDLFGSFYTHRLPPNELIEMTGLQERVNARSKDLSGGQKQRLSVALALVNDPDLIFLDEPTTGLDPQARRNLWDVIENLQGKGKTILLTTHYMEEAEQLCNRLAVMDHGKIIALDTPEALVRQNFQEQAIEFESLQPPPLETLRALPAVTRAETQDTQITIFTTDVPATMAALLNLANQGTLKFNDLVVRRATLEDVFLKLTGRRIRE
ncbi:MAG TPA: ABC transporter ATP-binding protein [Anaerolineae bacterium]|nr:ABC transporter ATP-binding protein [Anaerolineae bacterium]